MALHLDVDVARWRAHQDAVLAATPGLVPVVKGNGYGFGRDLLLAECERLGVPLVAIGTYAELPDALETFPRDVLVLEPYRRAVAGQVAEDLLRRGEDRIVHTIVDAQDLRGLRERAPRARFVVELMTSMRRFGLPEHTVADNAGEWGAEGVALHLPLGTGHLEEVRRAVRAIGWARVFYVSHLSTGELGQLRGEFPDKDFRPRIGTQLWLGDKAAYESRADVLAVHAVDGTPAGYRGRTARAGHIVVVSGGTSHGVAMEAPSAAASPRQRAIAVAEGVLEAAHRVRSPFEIAGRLAAFHEPPHMQVSMLFVPSGVQPPAVGTSVPVRLRLTTALVDEVRLLP